MAFSSPTSFHLTHSSSIDNFIGASIKMAPLRPVSRASTAEERELLQWAYKQLRDLDRKLQNVEDDLSILLTIKEMYYPCQSQASSPSGLGKHQSGRSRDLDTRDKRWWRWAASASKEDVDLKLEELTASKTQLEESHSEIRSIINDLSRPFLGNLNILDLPDELLLAIFEFVEGIDLTWTVRPAPWLNADDFRQVRDIKNTRLVCRRFAAISSQLLVRIVRVDLTEPSLARLEEISRHPVISKGVRAVKIVLHFFNPCFDDLEWFIEYHADELARDIHFSEILKTWERVNLSPEAGAEMIAQRQALVTALRRLITPVPEDSESTSIWTDEDESHLMRVKGIHRECMLLLEKQQSLVWDGTFSRVLGCAIARMPTARTLGFQDTDFRSQKRQGLMADKVDVWDALRRDMLQPMTCYHALQYELELPDYQCVVGMIDAVRSAGAFLNDIDIELACPGSPAGSLVPASDKRHAFSSGMRHLKLFSFRCGSDPNGRDADDVSQFLAACLDTASLRTLSLDMRSEEARDSTIDVEKVLGSRSRPELTDIYLARVDIHLSKLILLLKRVPESMHCLGLDEVNLLSGTWKEALDALRAKKARIKLLKSPRGAESDHMSAEDYKSIFESMGALSSQAEFYLRGSCSMARNPVQVLEDRLAIGTEE